MRKILFELLVAGILVSALSSCATEGTVVHYGHPKTEIYVHPYYPYYDYHYGYIPYSWRPTLLHPHRIAPKPPRPHGNVAHPTQKPPKATVRPNQNHNGSMSRHQRGGRR